MDSAIQIFRRDKQTEQYYSW